MNKTSFIIAEKSYLVRRGIIATLHEFTNSEVLKELDADEQLMKIIEHQTPDIVIVNPELCQYFLDKGGFRCLLPNTTTKFVGLSNNKTIDSTAYGFDATIHFEDSKTDIVSKIEPLIEPEKGSEDELTQREKDIVRIIALGKTNKEIGESLFISPHTVITHRKNITHKLGIKSVSGLTVYAILNNLITVDEVNA